MSLLGITEGICDLKNCQDYQENTPLHIAAINMDIDMVRALVNIGANLDIKNLEDSNGRNLLHILINNKRGALDDDSFVGLISDVISEYPTLVDQTDVNGDTFTPIHILLRSSEIGKIPILNICNQGNLEIQKEGARYDPPWVVQNADGNTPLHEALIMTTKAHAFTEDVVSWLIYFNDGSIGLRNKRGDTPFHLLKDDTRKSFNFTIC
ncbi:Serine/threonine-protein phosphatase 6 regulatory ankyrin repeat subunit B [Bienertia sinuspersici]